MEKNFKTRLWSMLMLVILSLTNCKKPYTPPVIASATSYLVVEGVIDPGDDTTTFRLSNTVNLSAKISSLPLPGATVIVSGNDGSTFPLTDVGRGYYKSLLHLNAASKYQLKIFAGGNNYSSEYVQIKNAPAIDTLDYNIQSNGAQVSLNTHDATNNSRYYRFTFSETYLIHSAFYSAYIVSHVPKDTVLTRPFNEQIYECWITDTATTILLGSTAKLTQDVLNKQPITQVASTSERFTDLYSILVKQYALTTDAYNYYLQLSKNTEQLGSIFDAQPSELPSNVHCTNNPAITVIGYVTAGTYSQKRLFIDSRKLPNWRADNPYGGCRLDTDLFKYYPPGSTVPVNQVMQYIYNGYQIPVYVVTTPAPGFVLLGYAASDPFCVDCTLRGTNVKPAFWPN